MVDQKTAQLITTINTALEHEMAMMLRYLHHSFIVTGPERGPLVQFFRDRVNTSAQHAIALGEKVTAMGGHPSVKVSEIYEPGDQTIHEMLREDLDEERKHIDLYERLLTGLDDVALRAFIEQFVCQKQSQVDELDMYLRSR